MPKVHIYPPLPEGVDKGDGGIRQVIRGQYAHTPRLGWEITPNPAEADVIHCHVDIPPAYLTLYGDKPILVSNHGAYWTPDYEWHQWSYRTNVNVLSALRQADLTTAVSEWTANALRRASNRDVRVVYHGVDLQEWPLQEPSSGIAPYVLWNKTRVDPICDPRPVMDVASLMPSQRFITTHAPEGQTARNITVVGTLPYEEGKRLVQRAAVYLCTTRETFGIGTLEALASGVPVVGYAWGGQREIITHGRDGWLVAPGDIEGLREGILWALSTPEARLAARQKAERYPVEASVARYVDLYNELLAQFSTECPTVSVVVTAYNLDRYLPATLDSVLAQTGVDFECIVVDDASPDHCGQIADGYAERDPRVRVIHNETNQYLAGARNTGIAAARGRFILPLDADDMIEPGTLAVLAGELSRRRDLDIAYGNVLFVEEDGVTPTRYGETFGPGHSGWPVEFRLDWMLLRPGQPLPYCAMFKRDVWELTGGYRTRARSSEDCDFWLRTTSYGFVAEMVTRADTLRYRNRPGSMSRTEGFQDALHRPWFPWIQDPALLPAAAYRGNVTGDQIPFPALDPVISVVVPVGPGHARWVIDAIDSVDAQTFRLWECIVVNDTGEELPPLPQWVRVVERPCCQHSPAVHLPGSGCSECPVEEYEHDWDDYPGRFGGVAAARNAGIRMARGALFLPLDADDILQPQALDVMIKAHMTSPGRPIIYSDFWDEREPGKVELYECADYEPRTLITHGLGRAVTALTPVRYWREVGGYDEDLPAWEDWAFAIACAAHGFCERRVMAPLFTYRKHTGFRREANMADFERSKMSMMTKDFGTQGGELMACSTCPGGRGTSIGYGLGTPGGGAAARSFTPDAEGTVMVEYIGAKQGDFSIKSSVSGWNPYVFSANRRRTLVRVEDAPFFDAHIEFRVIDAGEIAQDPVARAATPAPQIGGGAQPSSGRAPADGGLPWYFPTADPVPAVVNIPYAQQPGIEAPASVTVSGVATLERPEVVTQPVTVPAGTTGFAAERAALDAQMAQQQTPAASPEVERLMRHTVAELVTMANEAGIANAESLGNKRMLATAILAIRGAE